MAIGNALEAGPDGASARSPTRCAAAPARAVKLSWWEALGLEFLAGLGNRSLAVGCSEEASPAGRVMSVPVGEGVISLWAVLLVGEESYDVEVVVVGDVEPFEGEAVEPERPESGDVAEFADEVAEVFVDVALFAALDAL